MKKNSTTNQSTEEKDEKMKTIEDIRKHLDKYENIKNSKKFTYRQKDILSLMLFRGNGQDEGFTMGYKHITDTFGYSSTAISAAISLFKDYNFISVEKGHTGTNSKYTLNYEAMKNFKSSSTVSVSDSEIREAKSEKRSKIREEKTYDAVIQLLTRLLSDLQIREEKRRESEKRYIADIQLLTRLLSDKFDTVIDLMNQRLNININNNINKNLKDNISSNNNTEGNNTKDQEKKKNISTGNLEKLKENSNDEIFNDEDNQRENESLNEIENTSKDKLLDNENPDNENNIPSDENENTSKVESSKDENLNESRIPSDEGNISDNENPKDYPPLDVDGFFEDSNSTEYRTNENPSKANGSSKEDGGLSEDKNPSDENPSKANENPEDNEISVFGDSNTTDEDKDKDNDKWYESSRSSKSDNHANGMFTNLISELTSNENPKVNEISNDNNSKTSENMKKTNNKTNTIPSEGKNPSDENPKTNENLNVFGKLQLIRDLNSGRIDGYQFNSYDNLNDSRDYSKSFHASVLCLNLEPSDLKKVSASDTGVWGILNRTNGVYSFIPSNVGPSYAPNNALQGDETSKVDNHTAEGEKVAPVQSTIANKESEGNNDTTADNKKDEKATETVYADEKNAEVDNHTTSTEITAGNSVKMRPEPSDSNTNTTDTPNNDLQASKTSEVDSNTTKGEIIAPVQSQNTNKQSDVCYDMYGISTDEMNDILSHHGNYNTKPSKGAWRQMTIHLHGEQTTVSEALNHFKDKKKDGKEYMECNTFLYYFTPICNEVEKLLKTKTMNDEQYQDFLSIIGKLTRGKFAYWRKVFSTRSPRPNFPSEQEMWKLLGCPQVTNKNINKTVDNNKVYEDNVILPTDKDFESKSLDEIKNTLLTFVAEHPNLSDDKKAYINNLCIAYTLEPQYVA